MTQSNLKISPYGDAGVETDKDQSTAPKDFFTIENGVSFAGKHLLLDFWGAENLTNPQFVENALRQAASDAGATVLFSHMHHFTPHDGVTGVVLLAESHITIHTWPERNYAAIDIFMCGNCDVRRAVPALRAAFSPTQINVQTEKRGRSSMHQEGNNILA